MGKLRSVSKHQSICFRTLGSFRSRAKGAEHVYELIEEVVDRKGVRRYVLRDLEHLAWVETLDVETVSKRTERISESDVAKFLEKRNIQRSWYNAPRWYRFHSYYITEEMESMPWECWYRDDKAPKTFDVWKAIGEETRPSFCGHGGPVREIILEKYPSGELYLVSPKDLGRCAKEIGPEPPRYHTLTRRLRWLGLYLTRVGMLVALITVGVVLIPVWVARRLVRSLWCLGRYLIFLARIIHKFEDKESLRVLEEL